MALTRPPARIAVAALLGAATLGVLRQTVSRRPLADAGPLSSIPPLFARTPAAAAAWAERVAAARRSPGGRIRWAPDEVNTAPDTRSRGEDLAVLSELFYADGYALTGGVFGEVGALDGRIGSNSFPFENITGWRGVLIEGCPDISRRIPERRPLAVAVRQAVCPAGSGGTTLYSGLCGPGGGLHDVMPKNIAKLRFKCKPGQPCNQVAPVRVPCAPMSEILREVRMPCIDFLSVDVEGFELGLLSTIDFSQVEIRSLIVEMDSVENRTGVAGLLTAAGYEHWAFVGPGLNNQIWRRRGHSPAGLPCNPQHAGWHPVELPPGYPLAPGVTEMPGLSAYGLPVFLVRAGQPVPKHALDIIKLLKRPKFTEYILSYAPRLPDAQDSAP